MKKTIFGALRIVAKMVKPYIKKWAKDVLTPYLQKQINISGVDKEVDEAIKIAIDIAIKKI